MTHVSLSTVRNLIVSGRWDAAWRVRTNKKFELEFDVALRLPVDILAEMKP